MSAQQKKAIAIKVKELPKSKRLVSVKKTAIEQNADPKDSKKVILIKMLQRPEGALIEELITATGWQPHSIRGTISGSLKKRLGFHITYQPDRRGKVYRIAGNE